jgi:hypothetical protein
MYVCGWPPHSALILSPIEHFEIASENDFLFTLKIHHAKLSQTGQSACAILFQL